MQHMKLEKTNPFGKGLPLSTPSIVGTHMKTKEYMEPSKNEFTKPTSKTFLSENIAFIPAAPK